MKDGMKTDMNESMEEGMCKDGSCGGACNAWMCGGMRHGDMCEGSCGCRCPHHKIKGAMIALAGVFLMSGFMEWMDWTTVGVIVSGLIILMGLKKMFAGMCKCC